MTSVDSPFMLNMLCAGTKITTLYCGSCSFSEPGPMGPARSPLKRVNWAVSWSFWEGRGVTLVSRSINTMMFADGACGGRSRSEEEVMQGHRRRRATQKSPATSISPKGGGGTASISLSRTRRRRARHKRHRIYGTRHLAGMTHKLSTSAAGMNYVPRPASGCPRPHH